MSRTTRTWLVGADPACDIVVDLPTVSGRHCRLVESDGTFTIEDVGSTNGTFVNGERIARAVAVTPRDQVTLGANAVMPWPVSPVASSSSPSAPPMNLSPASGRRASGRNAGGPLALAREWLPLISGLGVPGFLMALWMSYSGGAKPPQDPQGVASKNIESTEAAVAKGTQATPERSGVESSSQTSKTKIVAIPKETADPQEKSKLSIVNSVGPDGIGFIVVSDEQEREIYALGTATLVGPTKLLTAASVFVAADKLSARFPNLAYLEPSTREFHPITAKRAHPKYLKLKKEADDARLQFDAIMDEMEEATKFDNVTPAKQEQLGALEKKLNGLLSEICRCDAATAEIEGELAVARALADSASGAKDLKLVGVPRPIDSLFLSLGGLKKPHRIVATHSVDTATMQADEPTHTALWLGAPVLDSQGRVVGLFSRQSPGADGEELPDRFEHATLESAREIMAAR